MSQFHYKLIENGGVHHYKNFQREIKEDYELAVKAVTRNYRVYPHLLKKYKSDYEICKIVFEDRFKYFTRMNINLEIARIVVNINPSHYHGLPDYLKRDEKISKSYIFASNDLYPVFKAWNYDIKNEEVLQCCLQRDITYYRCLTDEQKKRHIKICDQNAETVEEAMAASIKMRNITKYRLLEPKLQSDMFVMYNLLTHITNTKMKVTSVGSKIVLEHTENGIYMIFRLPEKYILHKDQTINETFKIVKNLVYSRTGHEISYWKHENYDCKLIF